MKNIGTKIYCGEKKCIIIATKDEPYRPKVDPFNRSEIYPQNDYLLFIFKEILGDEIVYEGTLDVFEHQIEAKEW